ncbi:hypothetical protein [Listeria phage 20422-1]
MGLTTWIIFIISFIWLLVTVKEFFTKGLTLWESIILMILIISVAITAGMLFDGLTIGGWHV